MSTVHS